MDLIKKIWKMFFPPKKTYQQTSTVQKTTYTPAPTPHTAPYTAPTPAVTHRVAPRTAPRTAPAQKKVGGWLARVANAPAAASASDELKLYDPKGDLCLLGEQCWLASGGEGTVYECPQNSKYLIKIYKEETRNDAAKMKKIQERLEAMINSPCKAMEFLAWPIMLVFAKPNRTELAGFVMRKCSGKSVNSIKSVDCVERNFPGWDRKDLAAVALDFSRKVDLLAQNNVFINDFNPQNFLINADRTVSFIDCDSYQIRDSRGNFFTSGTYYSSHVAPELLLKKDLLLHPRTIHQVEFGAAIIIFNILMYGLHPYNYYSQSRSSKCADPETNLKRGRCPLSADDDCKLPQGLWSYHWSWLTYNLKTCFIETFCAGHSDCTARTQLSRFSDCLEQLIAEMNRTKERACLRPTRRKPPQMPVGGQ